MVQATDPTRSTGSATPDRPTGRNQLALVSLLLAFVFPLKVLVQMLPLLLAPQSKSLPDSVPLWILNNLLSVISVPALIATLVTGLTDTGKSTLYWSSAISSDTSGLTQMPSQGAIRPGASQAVMISGTTAQSFTVSFIGQGGSATITVLCPQAVWG
jgi:hypothetical protein